MECRRSRCGFAAEQDAAGADSELGQVDPERVRVLVIVGMQRKAPIDRGHRGQMEAIRKTVSSVIGVFDAMSATPCPQKNSRDPSRTTPTARPTAGQRLRISPTLAVSSRSSTPRHGCSFPVVQPVEDVPRVLQLT